MANRTHVAAAVCFFAVATCMQSYSCSAQEAIGTRVDGELGVEVDANGQGEPCQAYRVPKRRHRHSVSSIRVKEGFHVVDMAIMTNITYSDMTKLQIKVSTHNIGVESRKMIIKSFEESKTQTSGSNFTETIWADIWEPSMLEAAHEAPFGVRQPFEQSFHKFSRGNGRRSSRGGSKGLWTLEVDTENPSLSEDLPELEGWTLYLCRQGETLQSTPDIKEVLEDIDDNLPKVRSFSGAYRYNPFAGAGAANGLVRPSFASRMRTVRRGVAAWMVGTWLWKKWQGNLGSKHSHIVTFVEHLAEHKKKKSIMMHFDPVENTD